MFGFWDEIREKVKKNSLLDKLELQVSFSLLSYDYLKEIVIMLSGLGVI